MSDPNPLPQFRPLADLGSDEIPVDQLGEPIGPEEDSSMQGALGRWAANRALQIPVLVLAFIGLVVVAVTLLARGDLRAASPPSAATGGTIEPARAVIPMDPDDPYTFRGLDIHPDNVFSEYFAGAFASAPGGGEREATGFMNDFRWRLDMYRQAYGEDDNFTIRVRDDRTGQILEAVTMTDLRATFRGSGQQAWDQVNRERRTVTSLLRAKWEANGIPKDKVLIRWGYSSQTAEARDREERYVAYEVNLVRRLGLSLLATEIGTVETFNQDQLISSSGARSRYQMMPDILQMFDVETYTIPTVGRAQVQVREEHHPLLAMEPSMMLVRAYANAVGHELPGISAYHTGPGNIFKVYTQYLQAFPGLRGSRGGHVSDAYMWGVTEGFDRIDAVSSFGKESRVYLLKAYGALRATEGRLVDPTKTVQAERVRIRTGSSVTLEQILTALDEAGDDISWTPITGSSSYEKFRDLNPHISLPLSPNGGVPGDGNLRLTSSARNAPIRFFLPIGATAALRDAGLNVIGDVMVFNRSTFLPNLRDITDTDREYDELVRQTGDFGFTRSAKARLEVLHDRLQSLATQQPESRYRQTQAKIARIHRSVWRTRGFENLMTTTETLLSSNPLVRMGRDPIAHSTAGAPSGASAGSAKDNVSY